MNDMPIIKLEIQGMKYQISHALRTHNDEISKYVESAIDDMVKNFDYKALVKHEVSKAIEESIKWHFKVGKGNSQIYEAVRCALDIKFDSDNKKESK